MKELFNFIDENSSKFIQDLKEAVSIRSVSADASMRPELHKMTDWLFQKMQNLGIKVEKHKLGSQKIQDQILELPDALIGFLGHDKSKKTLLVYGHYDVQPALLEDGWQSDPFELVERDGKLFGRGSTDDKGPVLAWLYAIESMQRLNLEIPVNLVFCLEGMEESGSEGLEDLIKSQADTAFANVDCVCISDNYWLGKNKPCLTFGLRGVSYYHVKVSGPARDLHSGVFGGAVFEPMTDLVNLLSKLVDNKGKILIPGIYDSVAELKEPEIAAYSTLDFNMKDFQESFGGSPIHSTEKETLMHRWRYPSLSLHGIEKAFYAPGCKTVIPAQVIGKFSIRTVPNQKPAEITKLVIDFVQAEFEKLDSKNSMQVHCEHDGESWISDTNHYNFRAGSRATVNVFGVEPDMIREGGSIPITLVFEKALKKNVMLLPIGACDDGAHSINEKIDKRNFIQGIKLLASYMIELSRE